MKNQRSFVYWVVVILITVMAIGLVGVVWYYEENKESNSNSVNNSNSQLINKLIESSYRERVTGGQACEKTSDCWQYDISGTIEECTFGTVNGQLERLLKKQEYTFFNQTESECINNICELNCNIFTALQ